MICFPECVIAIYDLRRGLSENIYKDGRLAVIYDRLGRCATAIHSEDHGLEYEKGFWPVDKARILAQETVDVLLPHLKLREKNRVVVKELSYETLPAGMTIGNIRDAIFIQLHRVENPIQLVSTVIHELAHLKCVDIGHHQTGCDAHCAAWVEASILLTTAFINTVQLESASPAPRLLDTVSYWTDLDRWDKWIPVSSTFCHDCETFASAGTRLRLHDQAQEGSRIATHQHTLREVARLEKSFRRELETMIAPIQWRALSDGDEFVRVPETAVDLSRKRVRLE